MRVVTEQIVLQQVVSEAHAVAQPLTFATLTWCTAQISGAYITATLNDPELQTKVYMLHQLHTVCDIQMISAVTPTSAKRAC